MKLKLNWIWCSFIFQEEGTTMNERENNMRIEKGTCDSDWHVTNLPMF